MRRAVVLSILGGLLLGANPPAPLVGAARPADPHQQILVRTFDYAQVPREELEAARQAAGETLAEAGVAPVWLDCLPATPACLAPLGRGDVFLNVMPHFRPEPGAELARAAGFVRFPLLEGTARLAYISYGRVRELAPRNADARVRILTLVMAHEVAHVLLGPGAHECEGVMRARWRVEAVTAAGGEGPRFTPAQAARLRAAVLARQPVQELLVAGAP
jgi:hypothetical protein